jgi:hypothetical protein
MNTDETHIGTTAIMRYQHVDELAVVDRDPMPSDSSRPRDGYSASSVLPRCHRALPVG